MHGNGCQQAFSHCTTIRALSLQPLGGWQSIAPNRSAVKCRTYKVAGTFPFLKYQRLAPIENSWCELAYTNGPSPLVGPEWRICGCLRANRRHRAAFRPKPGVFVHIKRGNSYCSSLTLTTGSSVTGFLMTPAGPIIWICRSDHLAVQYMPPGLIRVY